MIIISTYATDVSACFFDADGYGKEPLTTVL